MMMDFSNLDVWYGDILVYLIIHELDIKVFSRVGDRDNINRFMKYIITNHENIHQNIVSYLYKYENTSGNQKLRYWIALASNLLLSEKLEDRYYTDIFKKYIEKGIAYTLQIYNPEVLEEEQLYDVNKGEHKFFLYLEKASTIKEKDLKGYVQYLRRALKEHPMKRGIELLMKDVKEEKSKGNTNRVKNEFEEYKKMVKENLGILVNQNRIHEAKELITQYENIVKDDLDIFSIKGVIAIMEGDMDTAEKVLLEGISLQRDNFDLLYNLAYLYEIQEKYVMAYKYYINVLEFKNKDMDREIRRKIEELEKLEVVKEYKYDQ
jgi:hypothetical protein